ncbi:hypothetical protein GFS60_07202 (plasmid) [Rhodococcus sp. WAY2]|nr:hypothetical protein GFS60_07202 [Rhodococcus sp. WAY2]
MLKIDHLVRFVSVIDKRYRYFYDGLYAGSGGSDGHHRASILFHRGYPPIALREDLGRQVGGERVRGYCGVPGIDVNP